MIFKGEIGAAGDIFGIFNLKIWIFKPHLTSARFVSLAMCFVSIAMAYWHATCQWHVACQLTWPLSRTFRDRNAWFRGMGRGGEGSGGRGTAVNSLNTHTVRIECINQTFFSVQSIEFNKSGGLFIGMWLIEITETRRQNLACGEHLHWHTFRLGFSKISLKSFPKIQYFLLNQRKITSEFLNKNNWMTLNILINISLNPKDEINTSGINASWSVLLQ